MNIVFIRHSKTSPNGIVPITEWGLTEEGIIRAQELSKNKDLQVEVLYSSLQTKALETALLIAKPNAIPIRTDDRLTEVTSFTKTFEPDFDLYTKRHKSMYTGEVERLDNGESLQEALARFNIALSEIIEKENDKKTIGIVSHGNILGLFIAQYLSIEPLEAQQLLKMPDYAIFNWDTKKFITLFSQFSSYAV